MSRPQGHRKSQSTSALNVLASASTSRSHLAQSTATATPRANRKPTGSGSSRLGSVVEDASEKDLTSASESICGLSTTVTTRTPRKERSHTSQVSRSSGVGNMEQLKAAIGDIRSLRSSDRRRLAAVRTIERALVSCCAQTSEITLSAYLVLGVHTALVSLLTRHAQTLSQRALRSHTTLPASDEVAHSLRPELTAIFTVLQGSCLIDRTAKNELGQSWTLEMIIDLLLVLRAQTADEGEKPIVYLMLDLLCCILVDSPENSRTFEGLNGLEGVVRVLKGTGVAKEVRMKCIEFLYFYLLPENSPQGQAQRHTSASSTSTSSSTESQLFPPTPTAGDFDPVPSPTTPSQRHRTPPPDALTKAPYADLDITFVPQTPQKPHQPSLGYLTPSTRRVSGSFTTSLSVPPSPRHPPSSPSHRRLTSVADTESESENSGLGLGLPRSDTAVKLSSRPSQARDIPAIKLQSDADHSATFNPCDTRSGSTPSTSSSGSSTVVPGSRGMSRSSTRSALLDDATVLDGISRTPSMRRVSQSPSMQSVTSEASSAHERPPKVRHSRTSSQLSELAHRPRPSGSAHLSRASISHPRTTGLLPDHGTDSPQSEAFKSSRHRVSRSSTSAQLSDLASDSSPSVSEAGRPPKPRQSLRTPSHLTSTSNTKPISPDKSMPPPPVPKPTPRKGFPAGITKGLPSAMSSPNLNSPLLASKRIPSGQSRPHLNPSGSRPNAESKPVKSVEEKKELLGMWLGNVDALVQGVEKVSFWSSVSKR